MVLSIRKALHEDLESLCILMEELSGHPVSADQMANRLSFVDESQSDRLFVCEEGRRIVGLLGFRIRENLEEVSRFGEVSAIVVQSGRRRMGTGRFMMDYAERLARQCGCVGMWLVSGFGKEEEAHEFYRELGYEVNGYRFVKPLDK